MKINKLALILIISVFGLMWNYDAISSVLNAQAVETLQAENARLIQANVHLLASLEEQPYTELYEDGSGIVVYRYYTVVYSLDGMYILADDKYGFSNVECIERVNNDDGHNCKVADTLLFIDILLHG